MAANSFADTVVNGMLSWLKGFASWVLRLFDLAGSGGVSPLEWLSEHWSQLLIILLIVGVAADIIVWLIRWRPYWVWFRKKRIVVDDKEFFESDVDVPRPRPDTIVQRQETRKVPVRPPRPKSAQRRPRRVSDVPPPQTDVFEDELFRIKPAKGTRKVQEDAVFNVSDLPGAQKEKKRPTPKKRDERKEDDLFDIH